MKDYLDKKSGQTTFKVSKTSKAEYLIKENRLSEALDEINNLLKSKTDPEYYNLKAIILDRLDEYEKATESFDMALKFEKSDEILLNKATTLYRWAKVTYFPQADYDKALDMIDYALKTLPESEDPSEFHFLRAEILEAQNKLAEAQKSYLLAYKEFDKLRELELESDYLKNNNDTLISITGCNFYDFTPEKGLCVELVCEDDNEHDSDAVAVFYQNEKAGYVANSPYTLIDEVESASSIRKNLKENQKAEILFTYLGEYVIAKLKN